ncbi:MAG: hypothetical protein RLY71_3258 [Pseudomonadota bacterium]|jgi:hypothetical protein
MSTATDLHQLARQAGELTCLVHMAADLAVEADDGGDLGALWRLRALLAAVKLQASALHNRMDGAAQSAYSNTQTKEA